MVLCMPNIIPVSLQNRYLKTCAGREFRERLQHGRLMPSTSTPLIVYLELPPWVATGGITMRTAVAATQNRTLPQHS